MANTKAVDYRTLFNDVDEVYFLPKKQVVVTGHGSSGAAADDELIISSSTSLDGLVELPVTDEGVSFNTGEADITRIKLTTGVIWTSKAKKGDPDITFQVPAVAGTINALFLNTGSDNVGTKLGTGADAVTFTGKGYDLAPKKLTGALIMPSEDRQSMIILPNVEIYSSLNAGDGDNPAYYTCNVTPLENRDGDEIYILTNGGEDGGLPE